MSVRTLFWWHCILTESMGVLQIKTLKCSSRAHLSEVDGLALGLGGRVTLSQLRHHLHQVAPLGRPLRLDLDLPPPPPPLARRSQAESVVL